jgi:alpha-ketoglutarate-dependent taurine dioxygenase
MIARLEKVDGTQPDAHAKSLDLIHKHGFAVVQFPESGNPRRDAQRFLCENEPYGQIVWHKLSDPADGAVKIESDADKPLYISATSGDTGMHTDNTFGSQKVKLIALACEKALAKEGISKLIHSVEIYRHLSETNPKDLPLLFEPDVLTVERDGEIASKSIFSLNQGGRLEISYRADDIAEIKIKPSAQAIFREIREFVENPKNQTVFALKPGQILLVDNTAVLHGRSAFDPSKPRLLYRWWFD